MPRGLKPSSSQIVVSFDTTETAINTFTQERVDLQLNALDNEVFVVTAIKLDLESPDMNLTGASLNVRARVQAAISKQASTVMLTLGSPSCIATAEEMLIYAEEVQAGPSYYATAASFQENNTDTPSALEYLDVIATPDFFVAVQGTNNTGGKTVAGKLYGYRAVADSSTYAALVQSELLSH